MRRLPSVIAVVGSMSGLLSLVPAQPAHAEDAADVAVLRNTVVNILEAMVQKGLISKEAAEQLVADAQAKADADAAASTAANAPKEGDVRVTYVPDIVKDEISAQVSADVSKKVTDDVVAKAKTEGWGVPGALPDWVRNSDWSGDLRLRVAPILLSNGNAQNAYLNFQRINEAGGVVDAGTDALLNTTDDEVRYAARLRFGVESQLSEFATVGFRLATGDRDNPVSSNVGLDNYQTGFEVRVDEAFLRLGGNIGVDSHETYLWGGRMRSPFEHTELVWDPDLRFNGFALQYAWNGGSGPRGLFGSVGAFPLEGVAVSSHDQWLFGTQVGYEGAFTERSRFNLATAYYVFQNEAGIRNPEDSSQFDYTVPDWVQKGNTLFDISPDDPDKDLYALAAEYALLNVTGKLSFDIGPALRLDFAADFVTNLDYDEEDIFLRSGAQVEERADGWRTELRIGSPRIAQWGDWSAGVAYTYLERDAVVDAFTDSDFHGGGTDAEGYTLAGELGITRNTWLKLRYLSANEIDGPPLAVDIVLIDLNAAF